MNIPISRRTTAKKLLLIVSIFISMYGRTQKQKADSVLQLLSTETIDTNRVILLWNLASFANVYDPTASLSYGQQALELARRIEYTEGESRSLGVIANIFSRLGNYPRALDYNLQKLKIEEKRTNYRNLSSVLMNIGTVHVFQDEYRKALEYYFKADSVIRLHDVQVWKYNIAVNIGDAYDKLNFLDSAYQYYNASLTEAKNRQDDDLVGASLTGLGHIYRKQGNYLLSSENYRNAIQHLQAANDDDLFCEASLGLAKLHNSFKNYDSALSYASLAYGVAKKDGFSFMATRGCKISYRNLQGKKRA
jgi:tetratricopeptide (TPR) repeat protein